MNDSGYIKLHRRLKEWEWYSDSNTARVYIHILLSVNYKDSRHCGEVIKKGSFFTSYECLAGELRISVKSVRTALKHLKDTGEIDVKTARRGTIITVMKWEMYQGWENEMDILEDMDEDKLDIQTAGKGQAEGTQRADKRQAKGSLGATDKNIKKERIEEIYTPLTPQEGEGTSVQEERFEQVWKEYPKKVAKQYARKAWNRIKPDEELFEKMLKALREQKKSEQWQKENGRFIPNPATWLDGGYWENEPSAPARRQAEQKKTSAHQYDERAESNYDDVIIHLGGEPE